MIDATRGRLPAELGCVVDAALTSEAVAVAVDFRVGTTISIVTNAYVGNCAALSKIGDDRYVATIGGGSVVSRAQSVLADAQWSRARDYLLTNPVAIAAELPGERVLAVAQADPLDGWVAIDALDPTAVQASLAERFARSKAPVASKVRSERRGAQVVVRLDQPTPDDVIALIGELVRGTDTTPAAKPLFECPPPTSAAVKCTNGRDFVVPSIDQTLHAMVEGALEPVVDNGDIIGLRRTSNASFLLEAGDIILGIDDRRASTSDELMALVGRAGKKVSVAVRRAGVDVSITLTEAK